MKVRWLIKLLRQIILLSILSTLSFGCSSNKNSANGELENIIRRYNQLVIQGYQKQDMNPMQEVTTEEHARKLYHHMSALAEGKLRMESKLKDIKFKNIDQRSSTEATVETEEIWDFTHYRMDTSEKYAEEKDFIYRMGYILNKKDGRWIITNVNTVSGTSTNTVIPFPVLDRKGNKIKPPADGGKPDNHP